MRKKIAAACRTAEDAALRGFDEHQVDAFRLILVHIIGDSDDPGSCL